MTTTGPAGPITDPHATRHAMDHTTTAIDADALLAEVDAIDALETP